MFYVLNFYSMHYNDMHTKLQTEMIKAYILINCKYHACLLMHVCWTLLPCHARNPSEGVLFTYKLLNQLGAFQTHDKLTACLHALYHYTPLEMTLATCTMHGLID